MGCCHLLQPQCCQATEPCLPGDIAAVQAQLDLPSFNQKQAFKLGKEKSREQKKINKQFPGQRKRNKLRNTLTGYLLIKYLLINIFI